MAGARNTPDSFNAIAKPKRRALIFRQYNSNEACHILLNPKMPDWPEELLIPIYLKEGGSD